MKQLLKKLSLLTMAVVIMTGLCETPAQAANTSIKTATMKTTTGGDFVKGVSKAKIEFKLSGKKSDVVVSILNESGRTVYKKTLRGCAVGKTYSITWAGKDSKGKYVREGSYRAKITAGKATKKTTSLKFIVKSGFAGGDGSKTYPYKVANATQFKNIAKHNGRNFIQTANISFGEKPLTPMFTVDNPFKGTYDGKKFTISGIACNSYETDYVGLFRAVGPKGLVKNIKVKDSTVTGNAYVGVIAGHNGGKIQNCSVTNCIVTGKDNYVGAIAGYSTGKIDLCAGTKNTISTYYGSIGGIVGYNYGNVTRCKSKYDIMTSSGSNSNNCTGGIVGYNLSIIDDCEVVDDTISVGGYGKAGGVAGHNKSVIKNCVVYDEKNLISGYYKGGIAGENSGVLSNNTYYGSLNEIG